MFVIASGGVFGYKYYFAPEAFKNIKVVPKTQDSDNQVVPKTQDKNIKVVPKTQDSNDQIAGWKTYTNKKDGYSFKYLDSTILVSYDSHGNEIPLDANPDQVHVMPNEPTFFPVFAVLRKKGLIVLSEGLKDERGNVLPIALEPVKIARIDGYKLIPPAEDGYITYYVQRPRQVLKLSVAEFSKAESWEFTLNPTKWDNVAQQIFSTFKFTK